MSAASPGARTWSARSTTATRALCLALALGAGPAGATDAIDRIFAAASSAPVSAPVVEQDLRRVCEDDALCAAAHVAAILGPGARLEPVHPPDTDTIRWARTAPSVIVHEATDDFRIEIRRFGRKVVRELRAALDQARASLDGSALGPTLDLRRNRGGDLERMLTVAGYLIGPRSKAIRLRDAAGVHWYGLDSRQRAPLPVAKVLIGAETSSSAEVLAALLAVHAGAELCGTGRTAGKDFAQSVVPVTHHWRLLVERARIEVPGIELAGGLAPDRRC